MNKMKDEKTHVVHWQSSATNAQGYGEPISEEAANAAAELANKKYPGIVNWVSPASADVAASTVIPTFKEAERAGINGTGTALSRFIVYFTPASKEDEKEFRTQLEAVLDEVTKKRKVRKN